MLPIFSGVIHLLLVWFGEWPRMGWAIPNLMLFGLGATKDRAVPFPSDAGVSSSLFMSCSSVSLFVSFVMGAPPWPGRGAAVVWAQAEDEFGRLQAETCTLFSLFAYTCIRSGLYLWLYVSIWSSKKLIRPRPIFLYFANSMVALQVY
jgi:hypothetical protein